MGEAFDGVLGGLDLIFACILLYAAFRGYSRGFLRTVMRMASPVIGAMAGLRLAVPLGVVLADYISLPDFMSGWVGVPSAFRVEGYAEQPDGLLAILAFFLVFVASNILLRIGGRILSASLGLGDSLSNNLLGAAVSCLAAALFLGMGIAMVQATAAAEVDREDSSAAAVLSDKGFSLVRRMDQRLQSTTLGPGLGRFAGYFLSAALELRQATSLPGQDGRDGHDGTGSQNGTGGQNGKGGRDGQAL